MNNLDEIVKCKKCKQDVRYGDMIWLDSECLCPNCYKYKRTIYDILKKLGFNYAIEGFKLWYMAIDIYDYKMGMDKIYRILAYKLDISYNAVERLMRYVVKNSAKKIQEYFNYNAKVDCKTFLNLITREGEVNKWKSLRNGLDQQVLEQ